MHDITRNISNAKPRSTIAKSLNGIAAIVGIWALFNPNPYSVLITVLAAIPPITALLWLRSEGFYQITGSRDDPRPSLAIAFVMPSFILFVRTLRDFEFLSFAPTFIGALVGGLAMTFAMANEDRKRQKAPKFVTLNQKIDKHSVFFVTVLLITVSYAFGLVGQANSLLDISAPETYRVVVLRKTILSGYKGETRRYLWLAPWGPRQETKSEPVSSLLYDTTAIGETVCVNLHSGALKIPWYIVRRCQ